MESLEVAGGEEGPSSSRRGSVDDDPHGVGMMFRGASRGSRAAEGAMELFSLLRILGEGFRHLCMFRCQVRDRKMLLGCICEYTFLCSCVYCVWCCIVEVMAAGTYMCGTVSE